jgi:hypothetical protein
LKGESQSLNIVFQHALPFRAQSCVTALECICTHTFGQFLPTIGPVPHWSSDAVVALTSGYLSHIKSRRNTGVDEPSPEPVHAEQHLRLSKLTTSDSQHSRGKAPANSLRNRNSDRYLLADWLPGFWRGRHRNRKDTRHAHLESS